MAKEKKTFNIEEYKTYVNEMLASDYHNAAEKYVMCGMLEHILLKSNVYKGFKFINGVGGEYGTIEDASRKYF
jgi:hypothetical protein